MGNQSRNTYLVIPTQYSNYQNIKTKMNNIGNNVFKN